MDRAPPDARHPGARVIPGLPGRLVGLRRAAGDPYANSPTCPPVCQNMTVSPSRNVPPRAYAMSPASALAVYQWSVKSASVRAASDCASRDASLGMP